MIECAQAVSGSVFTGMMQSIFMSYGTPDVKFASKLYEALHKNGVRTFFFPVHAEPGKALHRVMRDAVHEHERVLLICSEASLTRNGVLNEIEESLRREAKQGGEMVLIPITLDDFIYSDKWNTPDPGTRTALLQRVVADFKDTDSNPTKFNVEFAKLLAALKKKRGIASAKPAPDAAPTTVPKPAKKAAAQKIAPPKIKAAAKKTAKGGGP